MGVGNRVTGVRVIVRLRVLVELVGGTSSSSIPGGCNWKLVGASLGLNEWMGMHGDRVRWVEM